MGCELWLGAGLIILRALVGPERPPIAAPIPVGTGAILIMLPGGRSIPLATSDRIAVRVLIVLAGVPFYIYWRRAN